LVSAQPSNPPAAFCPNPPKAGDTFTFFDTRLPFKAGFIFSCSALVTLLSPALLLTPSPAPAPNEADRSGTRTVCTGVMPPPIPIPNDERVVPPQKAAAPNLGDVGKSFWVLGTRREVDGCGDVDGVDGVGRESDTLALVALECGVRVGSMTPEPDDEADVVVSPSVDPETVVVPTDPERRLG